MHTSAPLPALAHVHLQAGQRAHQQGDFAAALREYQHAAQMAPEHEDVLAAFAVLAMDVKDWQAALRTLRHLDARFPGRHRSRLALTLFNLGDYTNALPLLQGLIDAGNTDLSCILAYAACLERTGSEDKSLDVIEQVYKAIPTAEYANYLVSALLRTGRANLLDIRLPQLLAEHPGNAALMASLSEHALTRGDYAQGFDLAHHRWETSLETPKAATLGCPEWDGTRFDGTLLITAEQGLGDEILSSSMFEDVIRMGQRAVVECNARLLPVFRRSFPALDFTDRAGNGLRVQESSGPCRKIPAIELGRFFRRDASAFPTRNRWLVADPAKRAAMRQLLEQRFPGQHYTGISWRSARMFLGDAKSIPLTDLAPLLQESGTTFIDLQYGDTAADLAALEESTGLVIEHLDEVDTFNDIDGLLALIDALDDVVSSSNTTVHIAGALGKPVAAMIPGTRYSLWYWGYAGTRTDWYPAVELYRGPMQKSWLALAGDVASARKSHR